MMKDGDAGADSDTAGRLPGLNVGAGPACVAGRGGSFLFARLSMFALALMPFVLIDRFFIFLPLRKAALSDIDVLGLTGDTSSLRLWSICVFCVSDVPFGVLWFLNGECSIELGDCGEDTGEVSVSAELRVDVVEGEEVAESLIKLDLKLPFCTEEDD